MKNTHLNSPVSIVPYLIISHSIILHLIILHYFLLYFHIKLIVLISLVGVVEETVISTWHTLSYLHKAWTLVILPCLAVLHSQLLYFYLWLYLYLVFCFLFLFTFISFYFCEHFYSYFHFSFLLRRTSIGGILRTTSLHPLFPMRCGGVKRTGTFLPPLLPLSLDAANRHNSNSYQCSRKKFCAKFRDCRKVNIYSNI